MKLFYKPGACSLASHITLRESGKDFTLDGVDLMKKRLENGDDFFAVNPKGKFLHCCWMMVRYLPKVSPSCNTGGQRARPSAPCPYQQPLPLQNHRMA